MCFYFGCGEYSTLNLEMWSRETTTKMADQTTTQQEREGGGAMLSPETMHYFKHIRDTLQNNEFESEEGVLSMHVQ